MSEIVVDDEEMGMSVNMKDDDGTIDIVNISNEELKELAEEFLIKVSGCHILVIDYKLPDKSSGGILYAPETRETARYTTDKVRVIAMGNAVFKHPGFHGCGAKCKEGDWIGITATNGNRYKSDHPKLAGLGFRVIIDGNVLGVVKHPELLSMF